MATTMIAAESTAGTTSPVATTTSKEEPGVETQLLAEPNSVDAVAVHVIQATNTGDAVVTATTSSVNSSPTAVAWSECLASPKRGGVFSPAKEMADKESLHGVGLLKALDRSKLEARADRRCSLMLLESASCYEKFGVALQKAIQQAQAYPSLEVGDAAASSVLSLAEKTRQLATRLREDIGTPLQDFAGAHAETVPAITQKYTTSRQRAYEARQRALLARQKYLKAVQQAEEACHNVKEHITNAETITTSNSEKNSNNIKWEQQLEAYGKLQGQEAADRVAHMVSDVKVLQRRYASLVEKENEAVKFAHNIEAISLESLEKLEQQRLCIFYDSLVRTFQEIKTCLEELVVLSTTSDSSNDKEEASKLVQQQRKGDFFTTFLKVGSSQPEKTGVADAETLGLSEEIGKLRDEVQSLIAARIDRIKKAKSLATFFEDIAAASEKLGYGLKQVVKHEDSYVSSKGTPVEHLKTLMNSCAGSRTLTLWNNLMKTLEREAEAIHQFARSLKNIKASKLDHFLLTDEKNLKDEAEMDDARWKHLCDAARTEMRADAKYRQSTAQTAKARERIRSVDMETTAVNEKTTKSPQKVNRAMNGMNKAFGNFLSILPDGGEQAMQMLAPEKRRAVAERSLQEADEKESKGKQALDSAVAFKNRVMETYKTKAEHLVKKYELEEISGAEDIEAATQSLVASVETLRSSRYELLGPMSEKLGEKPLATALLDLQEWTQKICDEIASEKTPCEDTEKASATSGFMLSFVAAESDGMLDFARIGKTDSFESDCFDGASDKDDASTNSSPAVQVSGQDSSRSLDLGAVKNDEGTGQAEAAETPVASNGQPTSRWLQKSFSTPMAKPNFKTFRKFQSMNENGKENDEADATDDLTETSTVSTTVPPQNSRESFETEFFMAFWPDYEGTPPGVTNSFACAFLPKDCTLKDVGSIEHGRLFLTHKAAVFVAWRGRKAIMQCSLMVGAEKHDSLFGLSDDTLLVTAESGNSQQSTLLLGCFSRRDKALEIIQDRIVKAKKARADAMATKKETTLDSNDANSESPTPDVTPVAQDTTIPKMEVVLSKKIRGVAMDKFHDLVWLDKAGGDPFYGRWLGRGSCFDINIGDWETSDHVGTWCGEKYTHKRSVTFKLKRNSMIGPPVAGVSQTQYCRLDGKDRSVMHMTVAFEGIPYSDTFSVEVRWVATRSGTKDIAVQVGVFVQFHKSTLLKSQIRNGTMTETKPVHESLFEFVKKALGEEGTADEEEDYNDKISADKEDAVQQAGLLAALTANLSDVVKDNMNIAVPIVAILFVFILWRVFLSAPPFTSEITTLNGKVESLENEVKLMRESIEELTQLLKKQSGK